MNKNKYEKIISKANALRWEVGENFHDSLMESIYADAERIAQKSIEQKSIKRKYDFDTRLDKLVTSRVFGFPIMFLLLAIVFWVTIEGANYPSSFLASILVDTFTRY